jgi:cytidylate kinase
MAKRADVSEALLETLDEKGLSTLEDWISSLVYARHLWPDEYLKILLKVATIGKQGRAVIVGRGANFVLPPKRRFSVRLVAPQRSKVISISPGSLKPILKMRLSVHGGVANRFKMLEY